MPLPTLEKGPHHFDVNIATGGTSRLPDHQDTLFAVKQGLIGGTGGPNPMIVKGSSDGSVAGMDAVDRWSTSADLVWSNIGGNHAWMVLEDLNGAQLLLDCQASSSGLWGSYMYTRWSPLGGFVGGSTTVAPTAPAQITMNSNTSWLANQSSAQTYKTHIIQSNDGKNNIVLFCFNSVCTSAWMFLEALDPVAGWLAPVVGYIPLSANTLETTGGPTVSRMWDAETLRARTGIGGVGLEMVVGLTSEGYRSDSLVDEFSLPNEISGEHPLLPMGIASSTIGARGRHGRVADVFYGTRVLPTGATFPDDVSRQFAMFADIVVPWNGTVPQIG